MAAVKVRSCQTGHRTVTYTEYDPQQGCPLCRALARIKELEQRERERDEQDKPAREATRPQEPTDA
jgi:hypothetical protein